MPLPAWREGERRTSTWGGTMIAVTKQADNPDLAWEFAKFAYMDDEALANRYRKTYIIPPIRSAWSNPVYTMPVTYLDGQVVGTAAYPARAGHPRIPPEPVLGRGQRSAAAGRVRSRQ